MDKLVKRVDYFHNGRYTGTRRVWKIDNSPEAKAAKAAERKMYADIAEHEAQDNANMVVGGAVGLIATAAVIAYPLVILGTLASIGAALWLGGQRKHTRP